MRFGERAALAKPHLFPWGGAGKRALAVLGKCGLTDSYILSVETSGVNLRNDLDKEIVITMSLNWN